MAEDNLQNAQNEAHKRLARLFILRSNYDASDIAMVLAHDHDLHPYFLAEFDAETDMEVTVQKNLSAARIVFGDPKQDDDLEDRVFESVFKDDPDYARMRKEFSEWYEFLDADRRNFHDLDEEQISESFRWPSWSFERFAALSLGKKRSLTKFIENGSLAEEFSRRIVMMESAGKLPEGHEEFLRPNSTPREYVTWTIRGNRFDLHPILKPFHNLPSYRELEDQLRLAQMGGDEKANARKLGAEKKRVHSLQRICMTLIACIHRVPKGVAHSLIWDPDKTTRFVGDIRNYAEQILGKDVPSDETVRDHIREAYDQLSDDAQTKWKELRSPT